MIFSRWVSVPWRKAMLVAVGALSFGYAVAVLCYVPWTPDIGVRCAFKPIVQNVTLAGEGKKPAPNDTLRKVGHYQFPEPDKAQFWAQIQLQRKLSELRDGRAPAEDPPVLVTENGEKKVRVVYRSQHGAQETDLSTLSASTLGLVGSPTGIGPLLAATTLDPGRDDLVIWCRLGRLPLEELIPSFLWFFLKLGLFLVGALVFWKRPEDRSAALFFLLCTATLGAYTGGYHWSRIATQPVLLLPFIVCSVLLPAISLHFFLVFPRPKAFVVSWPKQTSLAIYAIPVIFLAAFIITYVQLRSVRDGTPEQVATAWSLFGSVARVYLWVASLWYLASVVSLIHSYRTAANTTERNQVKWILFGSVAALVPMGYTLYLLSWDQDRFGAGAGTWPMFGASVCVTLAFAISITRYRLMQLDQIISRGMLYFVISFVAGVVYYAVVFVGMLVSGVIKAPSFAEVVLFSAAALVFLLALDLVRSRFMRALDRWFDRQKHQLDWTLRRMGEAIEQLVDPPTLARRTLQASADLLNVSRGAVYLGEGNPPIYGLAGCLGSQPPPLVELSSGCPLVETLQSQRSVTVHPGLATEPDQRQLRLLGGEVAYGLTHEGRLLAFVVLGPKDQGFFGPEDLNLLAAFAQLTSVALESARGHRTIELLNDELQVKVEKISEQQRRILALQNQLVNRGPSSVERATGADDGTSGAAPVADTPTPSAGRFAGIIGSSQAMHQVLEMVRKASASPSAVLICGESGTGKELLAKALHDHSPRAGKPYVKVHCAALSPNLLESELFGHVKGAFTGAHRDKVGRFELANSGTLFLDEIGDINLEVQTKLLRVLQEKTFERVGSSEPVVVDVRVIAATNQNLEEMMRQKRFREDLYFRLKVIPLNVPPLRERREDIPELVQHFLRQYAQRCSKAITQIDDDALALLKSYSWPGNIRELENVVERAVVVSEGSTVTEADLPAELVRETDDSWFPDGDDNTGGGQPSGMGIGLIPEERAKRAQREREQLVRALAATGGNKAEAARALGMARSTLISRLKKYGLS
jgi:transcriptional regulator with GAF, ATPase, and Fis domain